MSFCDHLESSIKTADKLFNGTEREWRESEGRTGIVAPRKPEGHDGRLHAGCRAAEARGAKQFGQKKNGDFAELLYFVGVPDGI